MLKQSLITILLSAALVGCSLAPAASNMSYDAYNDGEYRESLKLINRALSTYEYSKEEKANLLFLKAQNFNNLKQPSDAIALLMYINKNYPNTEAWYRAKAMLATLNMPEQESLITDMASNSASLPSRIESETFKLTKTYQTRCDNYVYPYQENAYKLSSPFVMIEPKYPKNAGKHKIEGYVDLVFDVSEIGQVQKVEVKESSPKNVFDVEAQKALKKWKYMPLIHEGKRVLSQCRKIRLSFKVPS